MRSSVGSSVQVWQAWFCLHLWSGRVFRLLIGRSCFFSLESDALLLHDKIWNYTRLLGLGGNSCRGSQFCYNNRSFNKLSLILSLRCVGTPWHPCQECKKSKTSPCLFLSSSTTWIHPSAVFSLNFLSASSAFWSWMCVNSAAVLACTGVVFINAVQWSLCLQDNWGRQKTGHHYQSKLLELLVPENK